MELIERDANKPIYRSIIERHKQLNKNKPIHELVENNALMRLLIAPFFKISGEKHHLHYETGINRFQEILKFINKNLSDKLSLTQMAEMANLNPAYFSSLFSKHFGMPPLKYVNTKKVQKAQTLLLATTKTLEEISHSVGYDDVFYFSRIFKKITGLPPARYRKQILRT
jgi:YesN/AraC family two-component response regulator